MKLRKTISKYHSWYLGQINKIIKSNHAITYTNFASTRKQFENNNMLFFLEGGGGVVGGWSAKQSVLWAIPK